MFELLLTSLLIVYLLRDLWDAILYGLLISLEIQIGQLLFNCASSGFPNATVYATWHVSSSRCSSVLSLHLSHCAAGVMRHECHEDAYVESFVCQTQVPVVWSRTSDVPHPLLNAVAPTQWTVGLYDLSHFTHVFNIVISLTYFALISVCVLYFFLICCNYVHIPW